MTPARIARVSRKLVMSLRTVVERELLKRSIVPSGDFVPPASLPWLKELTAAVDDIRSEAIAICGSERLQGLDDVFVDARRIVEPHKWRSYFLITYGRWSVDGVRECPNTVALLRVVPGLSTAFFSVLAPRASIQPHRGPWRGQLRVHLPLIVPRDFNSCAIQVGQTVQTWEYGKPVAFDDGLLHSVNNNTDEIRIVLLITVARPLRGPLDRVNKSLLALFGLSPAVWPTFFRQHALKADRASAGRKSANRIN